MCMATSLRESDDVCELPWASTSRLVCVVNKRALSSQCDKRERESLFKFKSIPDMFPLIDVEEDVAITSNAS